MQLTEEEKNVIAQHNAARAFLRAESDRIHASYQPFFDALLARNDAVLDREIADLEDSGYYQMEARVRRRYLLKKDPAAFDPEI